MHYKIVIETRPTPSGGFRSFASGAPKWVEEYSESHYGETPGEAFGRHRDALRAAASHTFDFLHVAL